MSSSRTDPPAPGRTCWASVLGGCGGGISRDHLVSANLFTGPVITVSGFPWLGEPRELPVDALASNMLCRTHNSALSPVDTAGGDAFRLIGRIVTRWREDLVTATNRPPRAVEYEIDGIMLERWFAKCAIGNARMIGRVQTPPRSIARPIFGDGTFPSPLGLYGAGVLDAVELSPVIKSAPLLSDSATLIAMLLGFYNLRFALWLSNQPPDLALIEQAPDWRVTHLLRHPVALEFRVRGAVSRRLCLRWNAASPPVESTSEA